LGCEASLWLFQNFEGISCPVESGWTYWPILNRRRWTRLLRTAGLLTVPAQALVVESAVFVTIVIS